MEPQEIQNWLESRKWEDKVERTKLRVLQFLSGSSQLQEGNPYLEISSGIKNESGVDKKGLMSTMQSEGLILSVPSQPKVRYEGKRYEHPQDRYFLKEDGQRYLIQHASTSEALRKYDLQLREQAASNATEGQPDENWMHKVKSKQADTQQHLADILEAELRKFDEFKGASEKAIKQKSAKLAKAVKGYISHSL